MTDFSAIAPLVAVNYSERNEYGFLHRLKKALQKIYDGLAADGIYMKPEEKLALHAACRAYRRRVLESSQ